MVLENVRKVEGNTDVRDPRNSSRKNEDLYYKMLNKDDLTVILRFSLDSRRGI